MKKDAIVGGELPKDNFCEGTALFHIFIGKNFKIWALLTITSHGFLHGFIQPKPSFLQNFVN